MRYTESVLKIIEVLSNSPQKPSEIVRKIKERGNIKRTALVENGKYVLVVMGNEENEVVTVPGFSLEGKKRLKDVFPVVDLEVYQEVDCVTDDFESAYLYCSGELEPTLLGFIDKKFLEADQEG